MTDALLDRMKHDDNRVYIRRVLREATQYIRKTKRRDREPEYRVLIDILFDIIDDYESGDGETAMQKMMKLRGELDEGTFPRSDR